MKRYIDADDLKLEITNYLLSCVDKGKVNVDITELQVAIYKIINNQKPVDTNTILDKIKKQIGE